MAKKTQRKTSTKKNRKISKKAQAEMAERNKKIAFFVVLFLLLFSATKLGIIGITLYNFNRIIVGSLAYVFIFGLVAIMLSTFFKKDKADKTRQPILGAILIFLSLVLSFQAYPS